MFYGRNTLSLEDVKSALHSKELRQKASVSGSEVQAQGLFVRGHPEKGFARRGKSRDKSKSQSRSRKDVECYYYHWKGHFRWDCPKLKGKEDAKKTWNKKFFASVVEDISGANDLLSVVHDASSWDVWILDSRCSYYVCSSRDWFVTYQLIDDGDVLMRNNMPCKTTRICLIKSGMHDGVIRTLTNVWHVRELKKNLISLGKLDDNGYKFSGED